MNETCRTCQGYGRITLCPTCGKYGNERKRRKRMMPKKNSDAERVREQIRLAKKAGLHEAVKELNSLLVDLTRNTDDTKAGAKLAKLEELEAMWQEANSEFWVKDRREYIALIKNIKRKENLFWLSS